MNHLKHVKEIGNRMSKNKADKWVKKYKKDNPNNTFGWLYGSDILHSLLKEDGCDGIWFFKGTTDEGEERLVLYPADHEGNILDKKIKSLGAKSADGDDDDGAADNGKQCPPHCP